MRLCLMAILSLGAASCTLTPDATELPGPGTIDDDASTDGTAASRPQNATDGTTPDAADLPVAALEYKGVRGGKIVIDLDGAPEDVLTMLLDFEHADGRRSWAKHHAVTIRTAERVVCRFEFEGKAGVNPTVDLAFDVLRRQTDIVLRYKLLTTDFGLQAFFGDYRLLALPTEPPTTRLTERVYIESGVFIANATAADIAAGLREDARLMAQWMKDRLGR